MPTTRQEVADYIRRAFRGVTIGSGVGLWEGQAIDDYADEDTRKKHRERDEKDNWERIPVETLNRCNSSLSFFDAEGMRFHLPAFLIAELNGETDVGPLFHLTNPSGYSKEKLAALSQEQKKAVREFLLFLRDAPDYEFDRADIDRALSDYWSSDENSHKS